MKYTTIETKSGKVHKGTLGSVSVKIYEHARKFSRRGKRPGTRTVFQVVDNTHGKGRRALRGSRRSPKPLPKPNGSPS